MESVGLGTGQLNIKIQIGSVWTKDFYFRSYNSLTGYTDDNLDGATFSLFLKRFKGDRIKTYTLTLGSGISFITYVSNGIRVTSSVSQNSIEEGEYYWELRRTDLDLAKISGHAYLTYDAQQ